jgi:hypothetical protein
MLYRKKNKKLRYLGRRVIGENRDGKIGMRGNEYLSRL